MVLSFDEEWFWFWATLFSRKWCMHVQSPQMMHDFSITENYAIFMDHALIFDPKTMITEKSLPFKCAFHLPYPPLLDPPCVLGGVLTSYVLHSWSIALP